MAMTVVRFKSLPEYHVKEKSGVKPFTVRDIEEGDPRIEALRAGCKLVEITLPDNTDPFVRTITDYGEWNGKALISFANQGFSVEQLEVALTHAAEDTVDCNSDRLVVENFLENFWRHLGVEQETKTKKPVFRGEKKAVKCDWCGTPLMVPVEVNVPSICGEDDCRAPARFHDQ
jgi:hypothetical protein